MRSPLKEMLVKYEDYIRKTSSLSTWRRYADILADFAAKNEGLKKVEHIFESDIDNYRVARLSEGVKKVTVNLEVTVIKGFLTWCSRMGAMPNPVHLKDFRETPKPVRALTLAEIQGILGVCESPIETLAVKLLFTTGLRGAELVQIEKNDFNFETKMLHLPAHKTKSQEDRHLEIRDDILEQVKTLPEGRVLAGYADKQNTLAYKFKRLCWKAGIKLKPGESLHLTRKTFGTLLLRSGLDLPSVRTRLGHASLNTTARYLASIDSAEARKLVEAIPL